jgi:hypothetical protein
MTAPKKNTAKSKVSPAPATKPAAPKPAAKKKPATVAPAAPAPAAKAKAIAVAPAKPMASPAVAIPAPVAVPPAVVKPVALQPVVTTLSAQIDIGFGNALYIRGEGPGLSWDTGLAMECVGNDLWRVVLGESKRGFTFKFLVNDLTWSTGPDYTAASGANVTLQPEF